MQWWRVKQLIRSSAQQVGLDITACRPGGYPYDFDEYHVEIIKRVKPFTMTSHERLFGLIEAVRYVLAAGIPGGFVECGVYKGGSVMAMALTLMKERVTDRDVYLYDTFAGMTMPTAVDVDLHGRAPKTSSTWAIAPEAAVRAAVESTGYPTDRTHYVRGRVEDTLPWGAPDQISLLRLDTDWYESTRHEMIHLFPRLSEGGVLIIDDYGQYRGSKSAVDEYFAQHSIPALLHRLDFSGRMCVKRTLPGAAG
jgi:O-methyltransferase